MNRKPFALALLCGFVPALAAAEAPGDAKPQPPVVFDLTVKGTLGEDPAPLGLEGTPVRDNLKGVIDRISKAKGDPNVKALLVRIRKLSAGRGKLHELRSAIEDFRKSGKRAYAVLELAETADYLVATAADEVIMPEGGWLVLKGLAAELTFYKGLFDKFGVKADMLQIGEFKGAGEPYTRTEMSPALRAELTSVLGDAYDQMAEAIATRQSIDVERAKGLIDGGPYTPTAAKDAGLINRIAYPDQIEAEIAKSLGVPTVKLDPKYGKKVETVDMSGLAGFLKMMQALSGETTKKTSSTKPKVALIYAAGMIQEGKSSGGSILGDAVMGADTVIKDLHKAEKDATVKAIVLRVDSPGGSAFASDMIWREVVRIEKPIVASMSDVAASGGYYISMGADKVFAEPGTLTGSIGVIGGKIALGGLFEKFGVTTDRVTVGKHATMFSAVAPFTDSERAAMKRLMEETYRQFIAKAAQGRKMETAALEKLAGGRVYTGRQAKKAGLVDELGTLSDAIAEAKALGGIGRDGEAELLVLPEPQGLLESLILPLEDRDVAMPAMRALLPGAAPAAVAKIARISRLLDREPVLMLTPVEIDVR